MPASGRSLLLYAPLLAPTTSLVRCDLTGENLDQDSPLPGSVELAEEDVLGLGEQELATVDDEALALADEGRLDVAGGVGRRVMLVDEVGARRHQVLQLGHDIGHRRAVDAGVDRDPRGRVRHDQDADAGFDAAGAVRAPAAPEMAIK